MSIVALHIASGGAFFSGSACLVVGMLVATFARRNLLPAIGRLFIMAGIVLIALSATPLPGWAWCVWGAAFVAWVVVRFGKVAGTLRVPCAASQTVSDEHGSISPVVCNEGRGTRRVPATLPVIACTLSAVAWELSWQVPPRGMHVRGNRLVVIGDSLSAEDFTEGGDPWPTLLAREQGVEVENLAFSGAKAGSAAKRVTSEEFAGAVVLLEIGGNDLLGGTTPAEFERDLEALLRKVCGEVEIGDSSHLVMMLELPLPPTYNQFGEIQRRLARRYDVVLIPKRYFASVLIGEEATLDGLHLSPAGHKKMAEMVWEHVSRFLKSEIPDPKSFP
jgi:acyl-CoA thioesterase-1